MENSQKKQKKTVNFRALKSGSYSLALCAAALVIVVLLNLLVGALPSSVTKLDASTVGMLTISDETRQIVSAVSEPVTMYLVAPRGSEDATIRELMERYADLNSNVRVETVDPDVRPGFTAAYTTDTLQNNSVIVESGRRSFVVKYEEIYVTSYDNITQEDLYNFYYYGIEPKGTPYFYGELMLTSAVDYVTSAIIPTLYALNGHSEDTLSDTMRAYFSTDNIVTDELGLLGIDSIPSDCSAILINNPKTDISAYEAEMLNSYMQTGGNIILITDFRYYTSEKMPNLASVTALMGMRSEDGLLVEGNRSNYNSYPSYLLPVLTAAGPAELLETTSMYTLLPNAHGIVLTGEGDASASSLLKTTTSSYVKKAGQNITTYEKEEGDTDGPFCAAASATLAADNGESKLVWYATPAIVSDQWDYYVNGGNSELFMASVNWMCEKAVSLSILAKTMQVQSLVVPASARSVWSTVMTILLPIAILGGGFYVWLRRRRR